MSKEKVDQVIERNIKNKLLLSYVINEYNKVSDIPLTEERLQMIVYLIQKGMEAQGIEGFTYEWEWKDDE